MRTFAIVGATSLIAEHCAMVWAQQPARFLLIGRDLGKLERLGQRIVQKYPGTKFQAFTVEFCEPQAVANLVQKISDDYDIDTVILAQGFLPNADEVDSSLDTVKQTIEVNAVSVLLFAQAFLEPMIKKNQGTIALVSSVAGDRGRKTNSIYGASKAMVSHYAQGLQHRLAKTNVKVVLIKPGPTATPMTRDYKSSLITLAAPESVARTIVKGVDHGRREVYAPSYWRFIMQGLCLLPRFIFHRLNI